MGFCSVSARFIMIVISILLWAFSAGCLFLAIQLFRFMGPFTGEILDKVVLLAPGAIMVVLVVLLFIIGMIGLCGACQESKCLQGTFCVVLLLIICIEVAGVVCSVVYKDQVKMGLEKSMHTALEKYEPSTPDADAVDTLQETLQCCGVKGYTDWATTRWGMANPLKVPESCCKKSDTKDTCTGLYLLKNSINTKGCNQMLYDDIQHYLVIIIAVAVVFALIQLIGMICTCSLLFRKRQVPYQTLNSDVHVDHGYRA